MHSDSAFAAHTGQGQTERVELSGEIVTSIEALRRIEERWRALAVEQGSADVSPDAFWSILTHWGDSMEPFVPVVRDAGGAVVGLLPLFRSTGRRGGELHRGPDALSFRPQIVAPLGAEAAVAGEVVRSLRRERREWTSMRLHRIPADADWLGALATLGRGRLVGLRRSSGVEVGIEIGGRSWESYLASKSRNFRSQLGTRGRSLAREHDVHFRLVGPADDVKSEVDVLLDLHLARFRAGSETSVIEDPSVRHFFSDFAVSASRQGWLRLWLMEIDGNPAAGTLCLHLGGRTSLYVNGFEPKWSSASVGTLCVARTIEAAFAEGARLYDFGPGDHFYKKRFGTVEAPVVELLFVRRLHPEHFCASAGLLAQRATVVRRIMTGVGARVLRSRREN
jgi:CelD/BcsL family acetyltransferase involved in cellulose biosynthesis